MKIFLVLLLSLLLLAGCSDRPEPDKTTAAAPTIETKGADDLVLRIHTGGGFVPVEVNLAEVPSFSLYGDGRAIVTGPVVAIYPGPALPNLLVRQIDAEGMKAILQAAAKAGLTGGDRNFDQAANMVTDMPTTTFVLSTDDGTHETSAYGIGFLPEVPNLSEKDRAAVGALIEFNDFVTDLDARLPAGSIGPEESYVPEQMRVNASERPAAQPDAVPGPDDLPQNPLAWPLAQPLSELGEPSQPEGYRCGVISGDDLTKLLPEAQKANQLTPWTSTGKTYTVVFRPLLPDESGC